MLEPKFAINSTVKIGNKDFQVIGFKKIDKIWNIELRIVGSKKTKLFTLDLIERYI